MIKPIRVRLALLVAVGALLVGCTAGDDSTASEDTSGSGGTGGSTPVPTGPAPGVTDDSIKVGVLWVDLESIGDIATLDHGDVEGGYQALFDDINANGGINGRTIDPVIIGVNPVGTEPAEAACTRLTQDEQVFVVVGFIQGDNVLCPLETNQTAVIGGQMSPERLERAQAPWYTTESGTDLQSDVIRAMADAGEFDGTLGVYGSPVEEAQINDIILPLLDELGVEVTETAILDTGESTDITAANAATRVAAERFEASGVDQVLAVGASGLGWASGVETSDYRPQLLLTEPGSIAAYANDQAGRDLSVLDDAVAGSLYGGAQNIWELPQMQECIQIVEDAGVPVPEPDSLPEDSGAVFIAGTEPCGNVTLLRALLEAAGDDLNYGSLAAGADGLEVQLANQPEPVTYGPPPSADGDPPAYLYDWDPDLAEFVVREN
jgi:hypothetical protein